METTLAIDGEEDTLTEKKTPYDSELAKTTEEEMEKQSSESKTSKSSPTASETSTAKVAI